MIAFQTAPSLACMFSSSIAVCIPANSRSTLRNSWENGCVSPGITRPGRLAGTRRHHLTSFGRRRRSRSVRVTRSNGTQPAPGDKGTRRSSAWKPERHTSAPQPAGAATRRSSSPRTAFHAAKSNKRLRPLEQINTIFSHDTPQRKTCPVLAKKHSTHRMEV